MRRLTAARRTSADPWWFTFDGAVVTPEAIASQLRSHLTDERVHRIEEVLDARTTRLAVVVEGMVDTGNIAAVMRTAEGFGVQPFHTIDTAAGYKHSRRTSRGAEKWLDRWRWKSPADCVEYLRNGGFRIVAAHLSPGATPIAEADFSAPTALVFGNELYGLSREMLAAADAEVMIPISGFVQSFNVSVAAALCLAAARRDRIAKLGRHGDLAAEERDRLRAIWYQKTVPHARHIITRGVRAGGRS